MTGAMYAAIGGLKTHMGNLNVIGNNIANCNTQAYKAQRMTFQESIYTMSRSGSNGGVTAGGNNPSQVGYGCTMGSIDLNMSPSTFSPTGYGLDCMLMQEGFFLVGDKTMAGANPTSFDLTRMGDFRADANGYITDRRGNCLYGFATVQNPYYKQLQDAIAKIPADAQDYDTQVENLTNTWNKTARDAGYDNATDETFTSTELTPLRIPLSAAAPTFANGGYATQADEDNKVNARWDEGDPVYNVLSGRNADDGSRSSLSFYDEDGNLIPTADLGTAMSDATNTMTYTGPTVNPDDKSVKLYSMSISKEGAIVGTTEKGDTVLVGYVAVANCDANDGVTHQGGYYYKCLEGAGEMSVSCLGGILAGKYLNNKMASADANELIGAGGTGEIKNGGLEASSTDIATEFSNMILTQRGYQANTRIITVTDSMLEELVNMKR